MEKNSLIKKFLAFSIGGYINLIVGFFIIPITTRILSPEQYGIYSIMIVISQILVILSSLAMEQSFVRFFFEEEEETRGKLLYTTLYPFFIIGTILSILIFIFRKKISVFIIGKYENIIWIYLIFSMFFMKNETKRKNILFIDSINKMFRIYFYIPFLYFF